MRRDYNHRGIGFAVTVNVVPARRFRWSFEAVNGVAGKSEYPVGFGLEYAFARGKEAAEEAIDRGARSRG